MNNNIIKKFVFPRIFAIGKRKTAIAKVLLVEGSGKILINNRLLINYFCHNSMKSLFEIFLPLSIFGLQKSCDINVKVTGGGIFAQVQAIKLGVARGLVILSELCREYLRKYLMVTRDSRRKEMKKYGLKKARKAQQYTKR